MSRGELRCPHDSDCCFGNGSGSRSGSPSDSGSTWRDGCDVRSAFYELKSVWHLRFGLMMRQAPQRIGGSSRKFAKQEERGKNPSAAFWYCSENCFNSRSSLCPLLDMLWQRHLLEGLLDNLNLTSPVPREQSQPLDSAVGSNADRSLTVTAGTWHILVIQNCLVRYGGIVSCESVQANRIMSTVCQRFQVVVGLKLTDHSLVMASTNQSMTRPSTAIRATSQKCVSCATRHWDLVNSALRFSQVMLPRACNRSAKSRNQRRLRYRLPQS